MVSDGFGAVVRVGLDFSGAVGLAGVTGGGGAKGGGAVGDATEAGMAGAAKLFCMGVAVGSVRFSTAFSLGLLKLVGGAVKWGLERTLLASVLAFELLPL